MSERNKDFYAFLGNKKESSFSKYQDIVIGNRKYRNFFVQEITTLLFSHLSGVIGIGLRKIFYPAIFKKIGRKTIIGTGVTFKQPCKISISDSCIIDDYANLCVRGGDCSKIEIHKNTFIGRNTEIKIREGTITVDEFSSIGSNCRVAVSDGAVYIGRYALIAAYCYIGAGNHKTDLIDKPIALQGFDSKGGVVIKDNVWIGAHSIIADGVTIGTGAIIGAHSYVNQNVPDHCVAFGSPAKVYKKRSEQA